MHIQRVLLFFSGYRKGCDSSFNDHSTRRRHEEDRSTTMSLGTDVHVESCTTPRRP